jgi:hypothetical protein
MWSLTGTIYICFSVISDSLHNDSISQNIPFYLLQVNEPWKVEELGAYPFELVENNEVFPNLMFQKKAIPTGGFVFWLLLFVLVIWAWLKRDQPRRMGQLVDSFFSNRFVEQWIREEGLLGSHVNIWLLLTSFVILALGIQEVPWITNLLGVSAEPQFVQFLWLFFGMIALFFVRLLTVQLGNLLLTSYSFAPVYVFNELIFVQASALLFFPLVLMQAYATFWSDAIYIVLVIAIAVILFISRVIKLGYLGVTQTSFSPFYIILYLCSLEILPLVALYAWLVK